MTHDLTTLIAPHGPYWAIEEASAKQLLGCLRATSVETHMSDVEARRGSSEGVQGDYDVIDGIAFLSIVGPMTKATSSMSAGTGTVKVRRQVRQAMSDDSVRGVFLRIDSPGGSVAGTGDLAADIAALAERKPVHAYIEDAGCSAAYWVASQCTRLTANQTALVGSIGTLLVIQDYSKLSEKMGIETLVFATGPYKGAGVEGASINSEQRTEFQRTVDSLNEHFVSSVAAGRGFDRAKIIELADGRVHIGAQALALGLVDAIQSYDDAVADLSAACRPNRPVSGGVSPRGAMSLAEESNSALVAVRGLSDRMADYSQMKRREGKALSATAQSCLLANLTALEEVCADMRSLLSDPSDDFLKAFLLDSALKAELAAAIP